MNRVSLNPIVITVVVTTIIIALLWAFGKYFNSVNSRILELEERINSDLKLLNLSKSRRDELTKKAVKIYKLVVTSFFFVFAAALGLTVLAGFSYIDALEIHVGTIGIVITTITIVFYGTWSPDILLKILKDRIKHWIYRKNGFELSYMTFLESEISSNKLKLEELKIQDECADYDCIYESKKIKC